ncbi:Hypothetical protein, putative [Bodo saltans]|uniref:Uncharacterized protein n=1 Tax=Bodo saltans TaxID=75058 RepID=A0A0S4JKE1_BODSA|nr:Hypothetical protein, putative [Bodo saltans]|eukprot:CUG92015.1 Hypothetical protein, putative [Bodo saltans]
MLQRSTSSSSSRRSDDTSSSSSDSRSRSPSTNNNRSRQSSVSRGHRSSQGSPQRRSSSEVVKPADDDDGVAAAAVASLSPRSPSSGKASSKEVGSPPSIHNYQDVDAAVGTGSSPQIHAASSPSAPSSPTESAVRSSIGAANNNALPSGAPSGGALGPSVAADSSRDTDEGEEETVSINPDVQSVISGGRVSQRYDAGGDDEDDDDNDLHAFDNSHSRRRLSNSNHNNIDRGQLQLVAGGGDASRSSNNEREANDEEDASSPSSAGRSLFDDAVPPPYSDEPQDAFYSATPERPPNAHNGDGDASLHPTLSALLSGNVAASGSGSTPKLRRKSRSPQHQTAQQESAAAAAAKAVIHQNTLEAAFLAEYIFVHRLAAHSPNALELLFLEETARHTALRETQASIDDCLEGMSEFVVWYQLEWDRKRRSEVLMREVFLPDHPHQLPAAVVPPTVGSPAGGGVAVTMGVGQSALPVGGKRRTGEGSVVGGAKRATALASPALAGAKSAKHVSPRRAAAVVQSQQHQQQHLAPHHLVALHNHRRDVNCSPIVAGSSVDLERFLQGITTAEVSGDDADGTSAAKGASGAISKDQSVVGILATERKLLLEDESALGTEDSSSPQRNGKRRLSFEATGDNNRGDGAGASPTSVMLGSPGNASMNGGIMLPEVLSSKRQQPGGGGHLHRRSGSLSISLHDDSQDDHQLASSGSGVVLHEVSSSPVVATSSQQQKHVTVANAKLHMFGGHISPTLHHSSNHLGASGGRMPLPPKDIDSAMSLLHSLTEESSSSPIRGLGGSGSVASPKMSSVAQLRASVDEARHTDADGLGAVSPTLHMSWAQSCDEEDDERDLPDPFQLSPSGNEHLTAESQNLKEKGKKPKGKNLTTADNEPAPPSAFSGMNSSAAQQKALKVRMIHNIERRIEAAKNSLRGATPQLLGCARRLMELERDASKVRHENAELEAKYLESRQTVIEFQQQTGFRNEAELDTQLHQVLIEHQDQIRALQEETALWKKATKQANLLSTSSARRIRHLEDKIVVQSEHHLRSGDTVPRLQDLTNRQLRLLDHLKRYISAETMRTRREVALAAGRRLLSGNNNHFQRSEEGSSDVLATPNDSAFLEFSAASPARRSHQGGGGSVSPSKAAPTVSTSALALGHDRRHPIQRDVFHRLTASVPALATGGGGGGSFSPSPQQRGGRRAVADAAPLSSSVLRPAHVVGHVWGRVAGDT